jgi:hypothetical protein
MHTDTPNDNVSYDTVVLNGTTYLPMDHLNLAEHVDIFAQKARSIGCILQRLKKVELDRIWGQPYVIGVYLVPVDNIQAFEQLQDTKLK